MVGRQCQRRRGRPSTADDISLSWIGDCLVAETRETLISADSDDNRPGRRRRRCLAPSQSHHQCCLGLERITATTTRVSHKKNERHSSMAQAAATARQQQLKELSQLQYDVNLARRFREDVYRIWMYVIVLLRSVQNMWLDTHGVSNPYDGECKGV